MTANIDPDTGIAYGVIASHLVPYLCSRVMDRGRDLVFEAREKELRSTLEGVLAEFDADDFAEITGRSPRIEKWLTDQLKRKLGCGDSKIENAVFEIIDLFDMDSATFDIAECVDFAEQSLRDDGYYDSDGDVVKYRLEEDGAVYEYGGELLWVFKSKYVTHCRTCAPTCPNAGDLGSPTSSDESNCVAYCPSPDDWVVNNPAIENGRKPVVIHRVNGAEVAEVAWLEASDHG